MPLALTSSDQTGSFCHILSIIGDRYRWLLCWCPWWLFSPFLCTSPRSSNSKSTDTDWRALCGERLKSKTFCLVCLPRWAFTPEIVLCDQYQSAPPSQAVTPVRDCISTSLSVKPPRSFKETLGQNTGFLSRSWHDLLCLLHPKIFFCQKLAIPQP